jgi:ABC-type amino acid transport substrate-binding protein
MCNPGGTNQIFVNQRLPHANIAINEFNNQIPSCVAKGIADVMITDDIEAKYYVAQDKTLCVQEIRFLKSQKCFYFNKSEKLLKTAVDKFLRIILADKTISKLMNKYIA